MQASDGEEGVQDRNEADGGANEEPLGVDEAQYRGRARPRKEANAFYFLDILWPKICCKVGQKLKAPLVLQVSSSDGMYKRIPVQCLCLGACATCPLCDAACILQEYFLGAYEDSACLSSPPLKTLQHPDMPLPVCPPCIQQVHEPTGDTSMVMQEITSFIKGSAEAALKEEGHLSLEQYKELGAKRAPNFSPHMREQVLCL